MDNENIPTTPAPEAPETTPVEEPVVEAPVEEPAPVEAPVEESPAPVEAPVEEAPAPVEAPVEEAPAPVEAPAPAEAPVAAPVAAASSNKAAIIAICSILGVVVIAAVVAIIIVNNNHNNAAKKDAETELANIEIAEQFGEDLMDDDDEEQSYGYDYDYGYNSDSYIANKTLNKCSSAADCIANLDNSEGVTVEQYNQAIGFNGTLVQSSSSYSKTYTWKFDNGDELKAKFSDYGKVDLEVDYEYSAHTSDVNLDGYDTVADRVEDGISYAELKAALGGVEGLLTRRSSYDTKEYLWVGSTAAKYIEASVNEKGLVTFVSGRK